MARLAPGKSVFFSLHFHLKTSPLGGSNSIQLMEKRSEISIKRYCSGSLWQNMYNSTGCLWFSTGYGVMLLRLYVFLYITKNVAIP